MTDPVSSAVAPVVEEPGFFSNAINWISDTAVKVWEAVKDFFAMIGDFITEHKEGFLWGALALVTGGLIVALFWFINGCGKSSDEPVSARDLLKKAEQLANDAKTGKAKAQYEAVARELTAAIEGRNAAAKALADYSGSDAEEKADLEERKKGAVRELSLVRNRSTLVLGFIQEDNAAAEAEAAKAEKEAEAV